MTLMAGNKAAGRQSWCRSSTESFYPTHTQEAERKRANWQWQCTFETQNPTLNNKPHPIRLRFPIIPSQIAPATGSRTFKYMSLHGTVSFKLPHRKKAKLLKLNLRVWGKRHTG